MQKICNTISMKIIPKCYGRKFELGRHTELPQLMTRLCPKKPAVSRKYRKDTLHIAASPSCPQTAQNTPVSLQLGNHLPRSLG